MLVNQVPKGKKYVNLIDLNGKNIEKLLETIGSVQKIELAEKLGLSRLRAYISRKRPDKELLRIKQTRFEYRNFILSTYIDGRYT